MQRIQSIYWHTEDIHSHAQSEYSANRSYTSVHSSCAAAYAATYRAYIAYTVYTQPIQSIDKRQVPVDGLTRRGIPPQLELVEPGQPVLPTEWRLNAGDKAWRGVTVTCRVTVTCKARGNLHVPGEAEERGKYG